MAYQVLARKWRPQSFETLVGQQHVMQALVNSLDSQRLHHAYLFTGTRGVGKTTIARLIAKALNCEQGISSKPCGVCGSCVDIAAGRFIDLLEVDAASRTKVEDTRDLLENVQYAPTRGRFKVYLIDEVHMLSGHSFNALLKTLEEPPAHVKFLLATTDPQKLPVTVLSRCLQFHLKNLQPLQITTHLADILAKEALHFDAPALDLLAEAANGSMRDALSLLDQAIAVGAGQVTVNAVELMLGVTSEHVLVELLHAFIKQDLTALLSVSEQLAVMGADYAYVLMRLQAFWHRAALWQFGVEEASSIQAILAQLAEAFSQEDIQLFYEITSLGRRDLPLSPSPKAGFEMVLLRLLAFRPSSAVKAPALAHVKPVARQSIAAPVSAPEVAPVVAPKIAPVNVSVPPPVHDAPWATATSSRVAAPLKQPEVVRESQPAGDPWVSLLPQMGLTAFSKVLAEHLSFEREETDHFYLSLAESHALMLQERHQQKIIEALSGHFKRPIKLSIQVGRSSIAQSPLEVQHQHQQAKESQALQAVAEDTTLQRVLQTFDAKVLPETLTFE